MEFRAYHIVGKLTQKPTHVLYKAVHSPTGRIVVIKADATTRTYGSVRLEEMAPILWGEDAVRCLRSHEGEVLSMLDGRGAPHLIEQDTQDDLPYLIIEWFNGVPLGLFEFDETKKYDQIIQIAEAIAHTLATAHEKGIVHRDLTPFNILARRSYGSEIETSIIDWELAQVETRRPWGFVGTTPFMAPELISLRLHPHRLVDRRVDLYALGAVLFLLATGRPPFVQQGMVLAQHVLEPAPSLSLLCPDAPPILIEIVDRLLEKDPADRPKSAIDLVEALSRREPAADLPDGRPKASERAMVSSYLGEIRSSYSLHLESMPPADLLLMAAAALDRGELVPAYRCLEKIGTPESAPAMIAWARLCLEIECYGFTELLLLDAMSKADVDALAYRLYARCLRLLERYDEALAVARTAVEMSGKEDLESLVELGRCEIYAAPLLFSQLTCLEVLERSKEAGLALLAWQLDVLLARYWDGQDDEALEAIALRSVMLALERASIGASGPSNRPLFRLAVEASKVVLNTKGTLSPRVQVALALAHFELGEIEEAMEAVERAREENGFQVVPEILPLYPETLSRPKSAHLLALIEFGKGALAFKIARQSATADGAEQADHLDWVRAALCTGQIEIAAETIEHLRRKNCQSTVLPALHALVLLARGDAEGAIAMAEQASSARPEEPGAWRILARALLAVDRPCKALNAAKRACIQADLDTHHRLAFQAAIGCRSLDDAVSALHSMGAPTDDHLLQLVDLLQKTESLSDETSQRIEESVFVDPREKPGLAHSLATEMIRLAPQTIFWRELACDSLMAMDEVDQAIQIAREARDTEPPSPRAYLLHIETAVRSDHHREALDSAHQLIRLDPSNYDLAWVFVRVYEVCQKLEDLLPGWTPQSRNEQIARVLALRSLGQSQKAWDAAVEYGLEKIDHPAVVDLVASLRKDTDNGQN